MDFRSPFVHVKSRAGNRYPAAAVKNVNQSPYGHGSGCSISLKMALISSSGRIVTFEPPLPSAANWKASSNPGGTHQRAHHLNPIRDQTWNIQLIASGGRPTHHAASGANCVNGRVEGRFRYCRHHRRRMRTAGFPESLLPHLHCGSSRLSLRPCWQRASAARHSRQWR